jgi:hypothetical protein
MTLPGRIAAATLLAAVTSVATAAPQDFVFDTLIRFDLKTAALSLTGVLSNDSTPTTLTFADNGNADFRFIGNRCVPVFLTMIEKPGRYRLNVTIDSADPNFALLSCGLELRS